MDIITIAGVDRDKGSKINLNNQDSMTVDIIMLPTKYLTINTCKIFNLKLYNGRWLYCSLTEYGSQ